jgi:CHASE2 domain-containing sensor protein
MTNDNNSTQPSDDEQKAARKARSERLNQIMWAYLCAAIVFLSFFVGFAATFIPLGFGILGCVLAWQLKQKGEYRHSTIAAAILLGGILIWLTVNWSWIGPSIGL